VEFSKRKNKCIKNTVSGVFSQQVSGLPGEQTPKESLSAGARFVKILSNNGKVSFRMQTPRRHPRKLFETAARYGSSLWEQT